VKHSYHSFSCMPKTYRQMRFLAKGVKNSTVTE
jgi:hypothetical protein